MMLTSLRSFTPAPRSRTAPQFFVAEPAKSFTRNPTPQSMTRTAQQKKKLQTSRRALRFGPYTGKGKTGKKAAQQATARRHTREMRKLEWSMLTKDTTAALASVAHVVSAPALAPSPATSASVSAPAVVAADSCLAGRAHVYSESGETYSLELTLKDASKNANKFYRMQICTDNTSYWLVKRWGRIGTEGQVRVEGPGLLADALKELKRTYKAKSGVAFEDRFNASKTGKYKLTATEKKAAAAGGKLADAGTVTFCLAWAERADLDIHVLTPTGEECCYRKKQLFNSAGQKFCELDVDKQAHHYPDQVENIYLNKALAPAGEYVIKVRLFSNSSNKSQINWTSTLNNTASGEAKQRETAGSSSSEQREIEVARFVL